ncbi:hypothetical protein D0A34_21290 [Microcoleus vaginatus PCC 9802]|nr:hypothetical protein D0A34_21290 [Microcoleus vaginatus PCC 9802]
MPACSICQSELVMKNGRTRHQKQNYKCRDCGRQFVQVLPSKRHPGMGKETGKTSYLERFNCTLRQRLWRIVRKTLSFSKKLENQIGAIWTFIHHYNATPAS